MKLYYNKYYLQIVSYVFSICSGLGEDFIYKKNFLTREIQRKPDHKLDVSCPCETVKVIENLHT